MAWQLTAISGKARVGQLLGKMLTPNFLLYTKGGSPPHFTKDTLQHPSLSRLTGFHVVVPDVFVDPGTTTLRAYGKGLHKWLNLEEYVLFMSLRDPLLNDVGTANDGSLSITTPYGKNRITPELFMDFQATVRPDIIACMSDEVQSKVAQSRHQKSVARSLQWLDRCLLIHSEGSLYVNGRVPEQFRPTAPPSRKQRKEAAAEAQAQESKVAVPITAPVAESKRVEGSPLMFGVVQGGTDKGLRTRCAAEVAKRAVDGFVIGGLESGESVAERRAVLDTVLGELPGEKPRVLSGQGRPDEVLEGIQRGVDLFESSYPFTVMMLGQACTFALSPDTAPAGSASVPAKIDLRDKKYARDTSPLVPACACYACQKHTRAYVHHLLNTHEMVGHVLLQIHNVHHYGEFFAVVRDRIAKGGDSFTSYKAAFLTSFYAEPEPTPVSAPEPMAPAGVRKMSVSE